MKKTRISGRMALITLATVCLLASPALSMPMGDGSCRAGHGAMFDLKNNLTPEEMDNLTLGELREMKMEYMNQSQFCPAGDQNCSQNCKGPNGQMMRRNGPNDQMTNGNGSCGQMMRGNGPNNQMTGGNGPCGQMMRGNGPNDQMMGGNGPNGQMMGGNGPCGRMMGRDGTQSGRCQAACSDDGMGRNMFRGNQAFLLMDDLNIEDLSNMTVAQVRDLIQTKNQELDNMTLAQIKQLNLEKMQKMENMTLSELKEENRKRQEMAGILGLAAVRPEPAA